MLISTWPPPYSGFDASTATAIARIWLRTALTTDSVSTRERL